MHNDYIPRVVKIERIIKETADTKTFYLPASAIKLSAGSHLRREKCPLDFKPGQFLEISYFGIGEAPVSISSAPDEDFLKLTFKRVGCVTTSLFNLKEKDSLGIRGPFGNGFPLEQPDQKDLVFIAGGIGVAPLRSLLKFILSKKETKVSSISFLYGARSPDDLLYKKELDYWGKSIKLLLTVDKPDVQWKERVGVVTQLLDEIRINPLKTMVFLCGPAMMLRFTTAKLTELGVPAADIFLSLERHMKCGLGKCGHCYIADKFVCKDGPVFTLEQLNSLVPMEIL